MGNVAFNMDCMEGLKQFPDKYFDLAVVDPPYGGGCSQTVHVEREREREDSAAAEPMNGTTENEVGSVGCLTSTISVNHSDIGKNAKGRWKKYNRQGGVFSDPGISAASPGGTRAEKYGKATQHWDIAPPKEYFNELARVSKNQIIWGGNYFDLPPTRCFLIWEKLTISENFSMAMAEYAWTSFNDNAKIFKAAPQDPSRFHPTQKPVDLYRWIYQKYAKEGYKILDTHLGSGSSRIAAYDAGLDFTGYEIDKEYFEKQEERFAAHTAQCSLFV